VYLPYPSVIITCTNILLFLENCLFLLIEWMLGDIVFFVFFGFDFSAYAMLCLQLADGVSPSFIKRITYLITYLVRGISKYCCHSATKCHLPSSCTA